MAALAANPDDFWLKGFAVEQLPDLQLLLTTTANFRGPHVDGEPELRCRDTAVSAEAVDDSAWKWSHYALHHPPRMESW